MGSRSKSQLGGPLAVALRSSGLCSDGYCHFGCEIDLAQGSSSSSASGSLSPERDNLQSQASSSVTTGSELDGQGHSYNHTNPSLCVFLSPFLCGQKEREQASRFGSLKSKFIHFDSFVRDGNSGKGFGRCRPVNVGNQLRCDGCFPFGSYKPRVPEVFLFHDERSRLHVSSDAFWIDNSALGVLKDYASYQELSSLERSQCELFHRRLFHYGYHKCPDSFTHQVDRETVGLLGFPDQSRKILQSPCPTNRISGYSIKSENPHSGSPCRQGSEDSEPHSVLFSKGYCNQERTRVVSGVSQLCPSYDSSWKNARAPSNSMDEFSHVPSIQRQESVHKFPSEAGSQYFSRAQFPSGSSFFSEIRNSPGYYDGCIRLRLERCCSAIPYSGFLDAMGTFSINKLEGNQSDLQHYSFLQKQSFRKSNQSPYGQYGSCLLFEKNGFASFSDTQLFVKGITFIVSQSQYCFSPCPHRGFPECPCGSRIQGWPIQNGMVLRSRLLFLDFPTIPLLPRGGPFRHQGKFQVSGLCFGLPGSEGSLHGCKEPKLERLFQLHLCLSSPRISSSGYSPHHSVRGNGHPHRTSQSTSSSPSFGEQVLKFCSAPKRVQSFPDSQRRSDCHSESQILGSSCLDALTVSIPLAWIKVPPLLKVASSQAARPPGRFATVKLNGGKLCFYKEKSGVKFKSVNSCHSSSLKVPMSAQLSSSSSMQAVNSLGVSGRDDSSANPVVVQLPVPEMITSASSSGLQLSSQTQTPPFADNSDSRDEVSDNSSDSSGVDASVSSPVASQPHPSVGLRSKVLTSKYRNRGFSNQASKLILAYHKPTTRRQFQSGWSRWLEFKSLKRIADKDVTAGTLGSFLAYQFFERDLSSDTIKNYFYAIREPFEHIYSIKVSVDEDLKKLLGGAFKLRPPKRGMSLMPKWSLDAHFNYLNSSLFEPLEEKNWDQVFEKCLFLTSLATGRRLCELSAMKCECSFLNNNSVVEFLWFPNYVAKAERDSSWSSPLPRIKALQHSDTRLCPVRAFKIFFELRIKKGPLQFDGRMWPGKHSQLSSLIRKSILASIGMSALPNVEPFKIGSHQIRKLAVSLSWKYFQGPKKKLCDWVGTRSFQTLFKIYIRDVDSVSFPCQVPLGTLLPNSPVIHTLRSD